VTSTARAAVVGPWLDVAVPAVLAVLTVVQLVADRPAGNPALVTALALASVLPLGARRRSPLLVTIVVCAAVVGQVLAAEATPATFASFLAVMVCVYTLARSSGPAAVLAGFAVVAAAVTTTALLQGPVSAFEAVYPLVYFGLAGGLCAFVRQRALRLAAVEDRAAALEGEVAREAELAAAQERERIARELHDVVAHGLSLMVVQAEAAEEVLAADPARAVEPIRRVQETGRQSLGEMRRLLGVLRAPAATTPQPSLARLPELVEEAAAGGLQVEVGEDGDPAELPLGVQLAAYRIVQEALTNVRRHAGATTARVRLGHEPGALRIEVTDDGHGPSGSRTGHGLIGMRERAALYGGTLTTGPGPDGGFRVVAVLPVEAP